jgi:hypothetical protein
MAGSVVRAMKSQLQEEGGSTNVGRQISESKISFVMLHNDEQSQKGTSNSIQSDQSTLLAFATPVMVPARYQSDF